jgi:hypothetical protein
VEKVRIRFLPHQPEIRHLHERLSADDIEEAFHIKPIYDRLKAVVAHERVLRNQLDRVALAADNAVDLCNLLSAHVEDANPGEDDDAL